MQHLIEHGSAHELGYQESRPSRQPTTKPTWRMAQLRAAQRAGHSRSIWRSASRSRTARTTSAARCRTRAAASPYRRTCPDGSESREDFAAFQGAIRQMDEAVGRILAALDDLGIAEQTLVVFATDHGAAMPRAKCTLYDPGIEVAAAHALARARACRRTRDRRTWSAMSTSRRRCWMRWAHQRRPTLHGRSLWPLLSDADGTSPRDEVFAEKTYHTHYEPMRAVRTARHKLILNLEVGTALRRARRHPGKPDLPADDPADPGQSPAARAVRPGQRSLGADQPGRLARAGRRAG